MDSSESTGAKSETPNHAFAPLPLIICKQFNPKHSLKSEKW
jgi:hypothetical protein